MLTRMRKQLGPAGLAVAIVALVLALGGAALAASGALTGKQKKEVTKIAQKEAKKYAGKPGAPGATGPQGPAGAAGPKGDKGDKGEQGIQGIQGIQGKQGIQGVPGEDGETGFTETLPSGKTETGNWVVSGFTYATPAQLAGEISFPIPLAAPSTKVVYLTASQTENSVTTPIEGCELDTGDQAATPVAPPGTLCVFTRTQEHGEVNTIRATGNAAALTDAPTGAFIVASPEVFEGETGLWELAGTWAVTAS